MLTAIDFEKPQSYKLRFALAGCRMTQNQASLRWKKPGFEQKFLMQGEKQVPAASGCRRFYSDSNINFHLYAYAGNNPVKYIDPDGRDIQAIYLGGVGAKLIIGGDVSAGIAWDDNGNIALAITGSIGVGVEAEVNLPFTPAGSLSTGKNLDDLKGIGAFKIDSDASGNGLETNVGAVFGINVDNESSKLSGWNIGIIGGGVTFASSILYIILKHGIGNLIEMHNKLDSASQKEFEHKIKEAKQMPPEIKNQIQSAIEEAEQ